MKSFIYRISAVAIALAIVLTGLAMNFLPAATSSITLVPASYVTTQGTDGGQPASNMDVMDQSGTANNWNAYVEFQTSNGSPYAGYQVFTLPSTIAVSNINTLSLKVNFLGPLYSYQVWRWSIYDWGTASWVQIGTNVTAQDWVWSLFTFNIPSPYSRWVDSSGHLRIGLTSDTNVDNADIDYEGITVGYSTTTSPTATSTSLPTSTAVPTLAPTSTLLPSLTAAPTLTSTPAATATFLPTSTTVPTFTFTPTVPAPASLWWKPGLNTSWQIQYSGTIDTSLNVQVYNLDGFDTSATTVAALHVRGIKVMCYISAGTWENWRPDASSFPSNVLGNAVGGWPGENWLDIRQTAILLPIMDARMDMCKSKGFDGMDPDNVDGYTNGTGFPLSALDQLTYNIALATAAHARGLGVGLKNDVDQITTLVPYFDWTVNEQCFEYSECNLLLPFIQAGKPVFNIEYSLATTAFCPQANAMNFNSLKKRLSLDAYRIACR